ncbi:MAG: glycosyltransferase [Gammaproteobacteria bacterium]|nr:glycosyltransferase [Gammaproteobacteria bacterium]
MRIRSRARRLALLATNVANLVRFAGGVRPFATYKVKKLLAGEWRALIPWMTTAANFAQRGNPARYRRWLRKRPPATLPDGRVLVLASAVGIDAEGLAVFLGLVAANRHALADVIVLVESQHAAQSARDRGIQIVVAEDGSPDTMVAVMGTHLDESPSAYRYVAFLAPGCVPGAMPFTSQDTERLVFYGDEDVIDDDGRRGQPFFKPGFSPDLLLHADYLSSCLAVTSALARAVQGRSISDFHSLALMLVEQADEVRHVDAFVAHRYLPVWPDAAPSYLGAYLHNRYGSEASVATQADGWVCHYGQRSRLVSVIIPTRDRIDLLAPCVEGLYATNATGSFEVIVLDNGSTQPETRQWLADAETRLTDFRVVAAPGTFNWSWLNNLGMAHARGDVFVFLNNDTEPIHDRWLARLADVACRADVGVVGALLLYPNGRIQHAGVVTGFSGLAAHVYCGVDPESDGHLFVSPTVPRNVAAVTGACLAVARDRIEAIGGFDEAYRISGGDVELCIRAMVRGFVNVYLPDVRLIHHESQSRKREDPETDVNRLRELVAEKCPQDPYYNVNLSLTSLYPSYAS